MPSRIDAKRIAVTAMLAAMALAVQYFESMLPPVVPGVPVRIGMANVFVLFPLLRGRRGDACFVSLLRCLLFPLVGGSASGLMYAAAGCALSLAAMLSLFGAYQKGVVGAVGVSSAGAFCFNMGQTAVGFAVVGPAMLAYIPWMGLLSIPAGVCTGLLAALLVSRVPV